MPDRIDRPTDELVRLYIKGRDKLLDLKKEVEEKAAPIKVAMSRIENELMQRMEESGEESKRTVAGTAFLTTQTSVTTADREAFLQYVIQNDAWEFADVRPMKSAITELLESGKELPPGVNTSRTKAINIRRASS